MEKQFRPLDHLKQTMKSLLFFETSITIG